MIHRERVTMQYNKDFTVQILTLEPKLKQPRADKGKKHSYPKQRKSWTYAKETN
jgi:hypothetical protein